MIDFGAVHSICFVCLGNICRSPLAEGVARRALTERGLELEICSAGTGSWHVGEPPDSRMQATAARYGMDIGGLRGAQVDASQHNHVDLFVAMDESNLRNVRSMLGSDVAVVKLLDFHDGPESEVPDPYYGGDAGFENVYRLVTSGVSGLLDKIEAAR